MKRRIPSWIALAASGVLVAASAVAQNQGSTGGDTAKPSGGSSATQAQSSKGSSKASPPSSSKKSKSSKPHSSSKSSASTSGAGTSAAQGMNAQMAQCTSKQDRSERAECARQVWESTHGTTG